MGAILGSPSHPLHPPRALIRAAQAWRDQHWRLSSVQCAVTASSEVMLSLAHMTGEGAKAQGEGGLSPGSHVAKLPVHVTCSQVTMASASAEGCP